MRNLKKEVRSPANQLALVQDSEPLRDQGMLDSINSHIDSKMSESDRSEIDIPKNKGKYRNIDIEVFVDGESSNDENEVNARVIKNKIREDRSKNISKYGSSLALPMALRKDTWSCIKHIIANYVSYENLSPQFRAFTISLDSTVI
ncbi:reverse transcriptase [Cucumis melo var. makuwa]|uniref:Reverse transcriptase n=1 Tax=Cucumis melo var. makuwa TaxID=1194695 RepID=A0A5D3BLV6_CUCMM|nr:reverse transcriptase [Cucumis melo var. makuwa]TYK00753.1 reverse transcriptase [Cucumis melo var. makuwa]